MVHGVEVGVLIQPLLECITDDVLADLTTKLQLDTGKLLDEYCNTFLNM